MKKNSILFIIISIFALVLAACGGDDTPKEDVEKEDSVETEELAYEPEDIDPEVDVCEVCAMAVPNNQHATQIVLENDKTLKFDDLGCLYEWVEDNGEDNIGAQFVRDFNTEEWIQIKDTTFVYDEDIQTPMAYGVISFKDKADAEKYVEEEGLGEILDPEALGEHEWKMNKEMMEKNKEMMNMDEGEHNHDEE